MASAFYTVTSLVIILTVAMTTFACQDGWTYYEPDRTCLKAFGEYIKFDLVNWVTARKKCRELGAELVHITDEKKNIFVHDMTVGSRYNYPWLDIKNYATGGLEFKYVDGTPLTNYHPWGKQPEYVEDQDPQCVLMYTNAPQRISWFATDCTDRHSYVCSVDSNDAS